MSEREALDAAWDRACRGVLEAGALSGHLDTPVRQKAWAWLCDAVRPHHGLGDTTPEPAALASLAGADPLARSLGVLALAMVARERHVGFDGDGRTEATSVMAALAPETTFPRASLWRDVTELVAEPSHLTAARIEAVASASSSSRFAELVVEAAALRVLAAFEADDPSVSLDLARRLSRKARAEAIRPAEYWAGMLLARARRCAGRPHLSARVTRTVLDAAPPMWRPWIDWELRVAGELDGLGNAPGAMLSDVLDAFVAGDSDRIARSADVLAHAVESSALASREVEALLAAIDPRPDPAALPVDVAAWARGERDRIPHGLDAAARAVPSPHAELAGNAWVLVDPSRAARRVLHPALGLLPHLPRRERTTRLHGRTELAASVLALAGPNGMPLETFVRKVYGFAYVKQSHDGMLRVLLHRMRASLDEAAAITIDDDVITLRATRPFLVPDPRVETPNEDRVLRMLVAQRGATAKELAAALDMPLRTVQAVLGQLVSEGACLQQREGAGVEYAIEDTTFSDPTRTNASPG